MDPVALARIALLAALLAISTPNAANNPPPGTQIYVVQAGDTLFSIALKFNTTIEILQQLNNLSNPNSLALGQKIKIPKAGATLSAATPTGLPVTRSPDASTYTVKAGDTLANIAAQFGLTVQELAQANELKDVNVLQVGQVLVITKQAQTYPDGVAINPPLVRQGNTVEIKITASAAVTATGTLGNGTNLKFNSDQGSLYALVGISRCSDLASVPVQLSWQNAQGVMTPLAFNLRINATNFPVENLTLTPQMSALLDPALISSENARVANLVAPYTPRPYWTGLFRYPLAIKNWVVTTVFGTRRSYNGGKPGACGHEGQDFGNSKGAGVIAPADGVVVLAAPLKVRGNVVFIDHGEGIYSGFYHMSRLDVKTGQRVTAGDPLGIVGTTGFSTGDHLHWSMWVNGVYVDPIQWTTQAIP